ncbi:hypothetical protein QEN19_003351 [Hanseniaspora menglaensis]
MTILSESLTESAHIFTIKSIEYVSCVVKNYAIYSQYRYLKRRKSVYGLSIDLFLGMFLSELFSLYLYGFNFICSNTVAIQYSRRYPLYYTKEMIPVSRFIILNNIVSLFLLILIGLRFKEFHKTKNVYQGVSKMFITYAFGIMCIVFSSFCICGNVLGGILNINYIDHLNILWAFNNYFLESYFLLPQFSLNYMCQYTKGLSSKFEILFGISCAFQVFKGLIIWNSSSMKVFWFKIPFNLKTLYSSLWNLFFIGLILLQSHYLYLDKKPTVAFKLNANKIIRSEEEEDKEELVVVKTV